MESTYTHYHDPKLSVIQSAVNEYINKHSDGRKGLNYHHEKIKALNTVLDGAAPLVQAPHESYSILQRISDLISRLFTDRKKKDRGSTDYSTAFKILEQYVDAKLKGDKSREAQKLDELRFSDCDPAWVKSMTSWFECYVKRMQQPKYIVYQNLNDFSYPLPSTKGDSLKIGLIGDWGTGEETAETILAQLFLNKVDVIIHLGDIYYSGTEQEYQTHFINPVEKLRKKYQLPIPVYNLPGNHDYYSGGYAFYDSLKDLNAGLAEVPVQEASYFTLSNSAWHLQGMDTGFYDNNVLHVNEDYTHLTDTEVKWHQHQLDQAVVQKKKVILLSHHQLFSRYLPIGGKNHNDKLLSYFKTYIEAKHIAAWFWGHEHLLEIYKPFMGLEKGRCIGNGAVPIFYDNGKPYQETASFQGKPVADLPEELLSTADFPSNGEVYDRGFAILELNNDQSGRAMYYVINDDGKPATAKLVHQEPL
jgi:hypothetical protein